MNVKKVRFSNDTKFYDGASEYLNILRKIILDFLKGKIDNVDKIFLILNNYEYKLEILKFIIDEIRILQDKLDELSMDELYFNVFTCLKKKRCIPLIRYGLGISKEKLTTEHIPYISKLYSLLYNAHEILLNEI